MDPTTAPQSHHPPKPTTALAEVAPATATSEASLAVAKLKPKIECNLKVPLNSNGGSLGSFKTTRCNFDWR
ncbi:hypothetical protein LguiA_008167 [Lonicera macranthoides]